MQSAVRPSARGLQTRSGLLELMTHPFHALQHRPANLDVRFCILPFKVCTKVHVFKGHINSDRVGQLASAVGMLIWTFRVLQTLVYRGICVCRKPTPQLHFNP